MYASIYRINFHFNFLSNKFSGPLTVFAPTDEAFRALPSNLLNQINSNPELLKRVLLAHVVPGEIYSRDLRNGASAMTLLNSYAIPFVVNNSGAKASDSNIVQPDVKAFNGVVHVIDKVIIPNNMVSIK